MPEGPQALCLRAKFVAALGVSGVLRFMAFSVSRFKDL